LGSGYAKIDIDGVDGQDQIYTTHVDGILTAIPTRHARKIFTYANDPVTVSGTTTETTLLPSSVQGTKTIGTTSGNWAGALTVRVYGHYGTTGTPTFRFKFKVGSTVIGDTGAVTMPSSVTAKYFELWWVAHLTNSGLYQAGRVLYDSGSGSPLWMPCLNPHLAASTPGLTDDWNVTITMWTASGSNTITATGSMAELIFAPQT
jgi:hypothetical protein